MSFTAPTIPAVLGLLTLCNGIRAQDLNVHLVGNAGVVLSDGTTSLLVDLPYQSGAFGYMRYDPAALAPAGEAIAVITHDHLDHFDPSLFGPRTSWRIVGPPSATAGVPSDRVITGDSVTAGSFSIVAVPSPHTPDHRSYRIRWRGRVLHFTGDTEDPAAVPSSPRIDVLFVTPWLQCALTDSGRPRGGDRVVLYHLAPDGSDRSCGSTERLPQGSRFTLS